MIPSPFGEGAGMGEQEAMKQHRKLPASAAAAIALAVGAHSFAQSAAAAEAAAPPAQAAAPGELVRTQHAITIDGVELAYTATAGTLRVRLEKSNAEASIFCVSYAKDGEDPTTRPITFVFNGGPGSSAAWLHIAALGPRRLLLEDQGTIPEPPARLVDNAETWLRFTDLVFVDPVGTGFSRAVTKDDGSPGSDGRPFWSIRADLRSLGEFIRLYLTHNERWASPKYLAGESYGGFRVAALVDLLPAVGGVELNGAVLISPVIEYMLNLGNNYLSIMPWVTFVPSYAATAFHFGKYRGKGKDLRQVTEEAEAFSRGELLLTLASDKPRKSAEITRVRERLAEITGLDVALVERHRGRIAAEVFATHLLEDRVLGIYDGSISVSDPEPLKTTYPARDPSLDPLVAPVVSSFNAYVRDNLNYRTDVRYDLMNPEVARAWDWLEAGMGDLPGVGPRLRTALSLNPKLKVLVAHGYFDLATPYFASKYVVERLELDATISPNLRLSVYPGGHMFFTHADARRQFYLDVKALYEAIPVAPPR
jgi:carboxypeptidase C (cathepsin A)